MATSTAVPPTSGAGGGVAGPGIGWLISRLKEQVMLSERRVSTALQSQSDSTNNIVAQVGTESPHSWQHHARAI